MIKVKLISVNTRLYNHYNATQHANLSALAKRYHQISTKLIGFLDIFKGTKE